MAERVSVPRGRHAPPLEVRLTVQRQRLLEAAAEVFAQRGYADASAEAISREAGMSKATFYEHFSNKEEAILALFDEAGQLVLQRVAEAYAEAKPEPGERVRAGVRAFVSAIADHPAASQTLLSEIIGAGPRAVERRDAMMDAFARTIDQENQHAHENYGTPRLQSFEDAYAIVGAISELASRHVRLGQPADVRELEPVFERLILGLLQQSR
jgi:AcrR family transcriptional regulator